MGAYRETHEDMAREAETRASFYRTLASLYFKELDQAGIDALEQKLLTQNAQYKSWTCSEEMMKRTKNGSACISTACPPTSTTSPAWTARWRPACLYRYRDPLYKEASFKPYIIAAMIFLAKVNGSPGTLNGLEERGLARWFQK